MPCAHIHDEPAKPLVFQPVTREETAHLAVVVIATIDSNVVDRRGRARLINVVPELVLTTKLMILVIIEHGGRDLTGGSGTANESAGPRWRRPLAPTSRQRRGPVNHCLLASGRNGRRYRHRRAVRRWRRWRRWWWRRRWRRRRPTRAVGTAACTARFGIALAQPCTEPAEFGNRLIELALQVIN